MALAFPPNPTVGQTYGPASSPHLWVWDGQKWACNCAGGGGGGGGGGGNGGGGNIIGNGVIGMPSKTIVFNNSGSYTPSAGITSLIVECIGGGGGGGAGIGNTNEDNTGNGGGSGAYSRRTLLAAQVGSMQSVTIGAGGSAGNGGPGGDGGTTSFGTLVTAPGGKGGTVDTAVASPGGVVGIGDFVLPGAPSMLNAVVPQRNAVDEWWTYNCPGGQMWGGGAPPIWAVATPSTPATLAGQSAAPNTGAGGNGGIAIFSPTSSLGGAGGSGVCIITEYQPA